MTQNDIDLFDTYQYPESTNRTHVPELEGWAINQMPKHNSVWDLRLLRYDGTDLYQWYGKLKPHGSEDALDEPFVIRMRDVLKAQSNHEPFYGATEVRQVRFIKKERLPIAYQPEPWEIEHAAQLKALVDAAKESVDYVYNPFEPDNQSRLYKKLLAALAPFEEEVKA